MANEIVIQVYNSIDDLPEEWDHYAREHQGGGLLHTKAWLSILENTYSFKMHSLVAIDADKNIVGILPGFIVRSLLTGDRFISLPFSFYSGPIADDDSIESLLLDAVQKMSDDKKLNYAEIKSDRMLAQPGTVFPCFDGFMTYRLDIRPSEEELWKGLHKSMIQRNIKKAGREGVTIERSGEMRDADEFDYLNRVTSRQHGIPAQPKQFFTLVWTELISKGLADCLFAKVGGKRVAAVILFYDKQRAIYMYGASLPSSLSSRPNHLLLWSATKRAKEMGKTEFDFGRVSPDNQGLADFKRRWGAVPEPLRYYYWPKQKGTGSIDRQTLKVKVATGLFSKLPLILTSRLSFLYKHLA